MKILIAGASGLIGRAATRHLRDAGHDVCKLVRRNATAADEIPWQPENVVLSPSAMENVDAILNLSGENVGAGRWTKRRRERILRSRVDATRTLVTAIAKARRKPQVFVSASAVGYYGDRGDHVVTEQTFIGHGFLPEVCLAWETHAEGAGRLGVRTVILRLGMVLAPGGGALAKMLPVFRRGLGGRLGGGEQWMSWVSIEDVVGVIAAALTDSRYAGPVNVVAPEPVTNREFTAALGAALRRPTPLPVPGLVLRLLFGGMADEALLASANVEPRRLQELGYRFRHPHLPAALQASLSGEGEV